MYLGRQVDLTHWKCMLDVVQKFVMVGHNGDENDGDENNGRWVWAGTG